MTANEWAEREIKFLERHNRTANGVSEHGAHQISHVRAALTRVGGAADEDVITAELDVIERACATCGEKGCNR